MNIDGVPKEMRNDETLVRLAKISLVEEKVYVLYFFFLRWMFTISPTMCSALPDDSVCHYSSLTSKTRLLLEYVECYITEEILGKT
jgi:hypothetical protein